MYDVRKTLFYFFSLPGCCSTQWGSTWENFYISINITRNCFLEDETWTALVHDYNKQISQRGRYSMSNINQQLTNCQKMLKIWCIRLILFLQCCEKNLCIYSIFFVFQFGTLKLAQGAIYLHLISVVHTSDGKCENRLSCMSWKAIDTNL